jgi:hypothetical protein
MDGHKKITGIVIISAIALALFSCRVQMPAYAGLYVDNSIPHSDSTAHIGEVPPDMVDTTAIIEAGLNNDSHPAKEMIMLFSDSIYPYEVKNQLKRIADSVQLLSHQMLELQKQLAEIDNTSVTGEKLQQFRQADGSQNEADLKQLLQVKNDTITMLRNQLNELKKHTELKTDTVYVIRETAGSPVTENQQNDQLIQQLLKSKDEQINNLQNQLNQLQLLAQKSDTVNVIRETAGSPVAENQQNDQLIQQLLRSKDEQINNLQNQLDQLQLLAQKRDTVYIEKEVKEELSLKEITGQQKETGFQSLHDTISLLKSRVLSLEEQIMPGKDTTIPERQDEKDEPLTGITDTTLFVAYYLRGKIKPIEEEKILQQIKELNRDKIVAKVTLSGYTDSSGDKIINKEITNRRLNYLSEMIVPWIAKEKIFFQNFGDIFASDTIIDDERRVEIRIYTKQDNSF